MKHSELESAGIYIHIPFCIKKCIYCDFASLPGCSNEKFADYFDALYTEIEAFNEMLSGNIYGMEMSEECRAASVDLMRKFPAGSVFIGGGTPTSVPAEYIAGLMQRLILTDDAEVTIEANPGTVTAASLRLYRESGINRISFGVQSFDDGELKFLGRVHNAAEVEEAFYLARKAGFDNINIDLMFGFPGQTVESWRKTIERTLELHPEHISFYSLQIEEGTPIYEMFRRGEVEQINDELNREMYHIAVQEFSRKGYEHYEISNAAVPGRSCAHNIRYWRMVPYIGFGAAAHSFAGGSRFFNSADADEYIGSVCSGKYTEMFEKKNYEKNSE